MNTQIPVPSFDDFYAPWPHWWQQPWVWALIAACAGIIGIWWWWRKARFIVKPLTPWERARAELEALVIPEETEDYVLSHEDQKKICDALARILRSYIAARWEISLESFTDGELLLRCEGLVPENILESAHMFFAQTAAVRFAHAMIDYTTLLSVRDAVAMVVTLSIPQPTTQPPPETSRKSSLE